jgi:hypothetical protein
MLSVSSVSVSVSHRQHSVHIPATANFYTRSLGISEIIKLPHIVSVTSLVCGQHSPSMNLQKHQATFLPFMFYSMRTGGSLLLYELGCSLHELFCVRHKGVLLQTVYT